MFQRHTGDTMSISPPVCVYPMVSTSVMQQTLRHLPLIQPLCSAAFHSFPRRDYSPAPAVSACHASRRSCCAPRTPTAAPGPVAPAVFPVLVVGLYEESPCSSVGGADAARGITRPVGGCPAPPVGPAPSLQGKVECARGATSTFFRCSSDSDDLLPPA